MSNLQSVLKFLSNLGLSFEESQVYMALLEEGEMTVLEISRAKKISRTTVYRIVERLAAAGLAEETIQHKTRIWTPVSVQKLELLVKEQESKATYLRELLPDLQALLPALESINHAGMQIKIYKGQKGIEQLLWNQLKEESVQSFASKNMLQLTSKEFASKWTLESLFRKVTKQCLVSDLYVRDYMSGQKESENSPIEIRSINWKILDTVIHADIYGKTIAFYRTQNDEQIGIEIHNEQLAKLFRQLFVLGWNQAKNV